MRKRGFCILSAAVLLSGLIQLRTGAEPVGTGDSFDIEAEQTEVDAATGAAVATGNVRITYGDLTLTADRIELNPSTKDVAASGNVVLERAESSWRGAQISGNLETGAFTFGAYRAVLDAWYIQGQGGQHDSNGDAFLQSTRLSTCEYFDQPHYNLSARRVVYHADGTFRAHHAVVRVGRVPVFYWPVLFGDTQANVGHLEIKPGYDSDWGAYLLLGREWQLTESARTKLSLELRSRRGVAVGSRTRIRTPDSDTDVLLYGMHDSDPPETEDGYDRRFDSHKGRYRVRARHRQKLPRNLTLRLQADALSDISMLEDWFRREYRRAPQPRSFADLRYTGERLTLAVSARPRVNDFFSVVEALPELRLDLPRQSLWNSGLYYEGQSTASRLEMKWRDFDKDRAAGLAAPHDYDSIRFDSLHMLTLPLQWRDFLRIVPRAGIRLTYYEKSSAARLTRGDLAALFEVDDPNDPDTTMAIMNYDEDGGEKWRLAGEAGLELKTKWYALWPEVRHAGLRIDGLRHIVEPYANYTYAPEPSEAREHLYFFDATDRLLEQHFVRVGVNQRWQTRRERRIYTLARMRSYADFHFAKEDEFHHFGEIATRIEFLPREYLAFQGTAVADMGEPDFNHGELEVRLGREDSLQVLLSYLYRNTHEARTAHSMGSTLDNFTGENTLLARAYERNHYVTAGLNVPINAKTSAALRYEIDIAESKLALQSYELLRDLHCWMAALRVEEEYGDWRVLLVLYLKAYPDVRLDTGF